jgi:hypothetical protein
VSQRNLARIRVAVAFCGYGFAAIIIWQVLAENWVAVALATMLWLISAFVVGFIEAMEKDLL